METPDPSAYARERAMAIRRMTRAMEMLLGLVTGMVADGHLHDREVMFLNQWLMDNAEATAEWPGYVIFHKVRDVIQDGVITEAERAHLLEVLRELAVTDFAGTGSAQPEVLQLPLQDVPVQLAGRGVCHTGVFLYGTRPACEALTQTAGGVPMGSVTKKVAYLVVGTNVSPDWAHTSYGRKIEQAMRLREAGHGIAVVSEQRWMEAIRAGEMSR